MPECPALTQSCDVLIIGGGCNGTGLARDLSKRGLKVVLCEKSDLGQGATGNSSAMIHGGPRYLLHDIKTTAQACLDSGYIQKIAPHLLFRIPFLLPVPKDPLLGNWSLLLHDTYFDVYDRYAPLKRGIPHACLSPEQMLQLEPGLQGHFLGGITLDEWGIDPTRLCLLNAQDARKHGANIFPYTQVTALKKDQQGRVIGAYVRSVHAASGNLRSHPLTQSGQDTFISARAVVNCAGAWAEQLAHLAGGGARIRPGKGVHLIYARRLTNYATITNAKDGRQMFLMPYQNETWIGTTDDDYYGDLDDMEATLDEVEYLIESVEQILPTIRQQRLIGVRVGARNTIFGWGQNEDALSRRHETVHHASFGTAGFFSIIGGKLASYRLQAEEAADDVCRYLQHEQICQTHKDTLPGGDELPSIEQLTKRYPISQLAAQRLIYRHGSLAWQVLAIADELPGSLAPVDHEEPVLECELRYILRHEYVTYLYNTISRCRLAQGADMGMGSALRAAEIFVDEKGGDAIDMLEAMQGLLQYRWQHVRPVLRGAQLAQAELLWQRYQQGWFQSFHPNHQKKRLYV